MGCGSSVPDKETFTYGRDCSTEDVIKMKHVAKTPPFPYKESVEHFKV